jgi:hypothetical protein
MAPVQRCDSHLDQWYDIAPTGRRNAKSDNVLRLAQGDSDVYTVRMDHDIQATDGNMAAGVRRVPVETRHGAAIALKQPRETGTDREALVAMVRERWRSHDELISEIRENTERLRGAVREFALTAFAQQMPPERMLIALKETVRGAIQVRGPEAQELMEDVVRWSVDAYYERAGTPLD